MDPVSTGLAGISAISGLGSNKKADRRARSLEDRQTGLFDMIQKIVKEADAKGAFDPSAAIADLEKRTADYEGKDLGNLAGALRVAGYREGDSEIGRRLDSVKMNYRNMLDTKRLELKRQSLQDKLAAYSGINSNMLNPAIQRAEGMQQNPGGFYQSLMPFLGNRRRQDGGLLLNQNTM